MNKYHFRLVTKLETCKCFTFSAVFFPPALYLLCYHIKKLYRHHTSYLQLRPNNILDKNLLQEMPCHSQFANEVEVSMVKRGHLRLVMDEHAEVKPLLLPVDRL